jgi:hypothetical protein
MTIKSFFIFSLLLISVNGYSQVKNTFDTYTNGHTERVALRPDSVFIFATSICLYSRIVSGKYTIKDEIYYLDAQHLVHDAIPMTTLTLYDTLHLNFPNKTLHFPLKPKEIHIYYPLDLNIPEKLTFRNGQMLVFNKVSKKWTLFYPTTNSLNRFMN